MKAWQAGVTNVGATSSATMAWRSGGQLRVTVITKSVFVFAPSETMSLTQSEPILDTDAGDSSGQSIRAASDRYPFRPRADVVFVGHAYAPGGTPAKRISARLAIANGIEKSFDKLIDVIGDRHSPHADPVPFTKMPVTYERSYGGAGFDANPVGVGFGPNAQIMPNIVYPQGWHRDAEPAAFGPIAASWSRRLRLAGHRPLDFLAKTVTEIPSDLEVSYFQCAPEDQRIAQLHGGEWILLENLHPTHARLTMRLPDVKGTAMVFGEDGVDTPIALRADTLVIDGDRELCILTCRGSHPIPNEAALEGMRIAAGIEVNRTPIDWADAKKKATSQANAAPGTIALDPNMPVDFKAPYTIAEPRQIAAFAPVAAVAAIPGAPFAAAATGEAILPATPVHVPDAIGDSTLALDDTRHLPRGFDALRKQSAPASTSPSSLHESPHPDAFKGQPSQPVGQPAAYSKSAARSAEPPARSAITTHAVPTGVAVAALAIAAGNEPNRIPSAGTEATGDTSPADAGLRTAIIDLNALPEFRAPYEIAQPRPAAAIASTNPPMPLPGAPFASVASETAGDTAQHAAHTAYVPDPNDTTVELDVRNLVPPDFDTLRTSTALSNSSTDVPPHFLTPQSQATTTSIPSSDETTRPEAFSLAPAPTAEKPEWSWATPAPASADPSTQQGSPKQSNPAKKPTEPSARAVIYSGFTRKG